MPAAGRTEERERLGLHGQKYCSGLGYVVNEDVLQVLSEFMEDCLGNVVSDHSGMIDDCVIGEHRAQNRKGEQKGMRETSEEKNKRKRKRQRRCNELDMENGTFLFIFGLTCVCTDTEIGRCVFKYLPGTECRAVPVRPRISPPKLVFFSFLLMFQFCFLFL